MREIITKNEFESLFINKGIDDFEGIKENPDKHFSLVEDKSMLFTNNSRV